MSDDIDAVKADIEKTRADLQETVDQLGDRLDPRVRAKEAGDSLKHTAADGVAAARQNPVPVAAVVAAVLAAVVGVVIWKRRSA